MSEPSPENPRGFVCPRCKGVLWKVQHTRPQPNRIVRIRTCRGCHLRIRTREVIEAGGRAA